MLINYPIDRHNHQLRVEEAKKDTKNNQQQDIFEIKPTYVSNYEVSYVLGYAQEGIYDTDNKFDPIL